LTTGPGEPHLLRTDLTDAVTQPALAITAFAQLSDVHVVDDQSPLRVEFLDRLANPGPPHEASYPTDSAYRAHECLSTQVLDAMCRAIARVGHGPRTGLPLAFTILTGDAVDNCQFNELRWCIDVLDGVMITPNSGNSFDHSVTGDSLGLDVNYWHAANRQFEQTNVHGPGLDLNFQAGFPDVLQLPDAARRPFQPHGLGMPWFTAVGNHDALVQGNLSIHYDLFGLNVADAAVGDFKRTALADPFPDKMPDGLFTSNPEDGFINWDMVSLAKIGLFQTFAGVLVPADPDRRVLSVAEFVRQHFDTQGVPVGHGFTAGSDDAFYVMPADDADLIRHIVLDTANPVLADGGILTDGQWRWLEDVLKANSSRYLSDDPQSPSIIEQPGVPDRLMVVYCHHTLTNMDNDHGLSDTHNGVELERLLLRFPNVILLVNGHSHRNGITPHRRPWPFTFRGGFWEIHTASLIDWPIQSRLFDITAGAGTLSIFTTMLDLDAVLDWRVGDIHDPATLAALSRELAVNDLQERDHGLIRRPGDAEDRNTQLLLPAPFALPDPPIFGTPITVTAAGPQPLVIGTNAGDQIRHGAFSSGSLTWSSFDGTLRCVAAATNADGRVELFGVNAAGTPFHRSRSSDLADVWSPWRQLPGQLTSIAVARDGTGRLEVFGVNAFDKGSPDGTPAPVWHAPQTTPGANTLADWALLDGPQIGMTQLAAATNADGRIELFGVTVAGARVMRRAQTSPGDWSGSNWTPLDGRASTLAACQAGGIVALFATDEDGRVLHRHQTGPGASTWTPWAQLDPDDWAQHDIRQLAAAHTQGALTLFAVDADGAVLYREQSDLWAHWGTWIQLPGQLRPTRLAHSTPRILNPADIETTLGAPVNLTLSAANGSPPYTWSIAGLPAGLVGDRSGRITGTPAPDGTGSTEVTATATDTNQLADTTSFTWTIRTTVPDVRGVRQQDAVAAIKAAHLAVGNQDRDNSCLEPVGFVVTQYPPPGVHLPLGAAVNVTISTGKDAHGHPCELK
jgi:metallophosphoesterase (TIGR03767 family)